MKLERRKRRLVELLQKMRDGQDVAQRDMQNVLTAEEYDDLKSRWEDEKDRRALKKPLELTRYESLLKNALLAHARNDSYSRKRMGWMPSAQYKLSTDAMTSFERAMEYLQEVVDFDMNIQMWLDRELKSAVKAVVGDVSSLPRVVTSRSPECQGRGIKSRQSKRELKILALEEALDALENSLPVLDNDELLSELEMNFGKPRAKLNFDKFKF